MQGNKDSGKVKDDEEEGESDEKKELLKFNEDFTGESELVKGLLTLMSALLEQNSQLAGVLANFPNLQRMFTCGMVKSENYKLRSEFTNRNTLLTVQLASLHPNQRSEG